MLLPSTDILTFCPTAPRVEPETLQSILSQEGRYFDVMFTHDNPYSQEWGEVYKNIQLNYNKMREVALSRNYKKVFVVESDMILPNDALEKLMAVDAPIATGLYALRHGKPSPNLMKRKTVINGGSGWNWEEVKAEWGNTVEVGGGCMGCVLIDRSVLEKFTFILNGTGAPDVPLMQFCTDNNIKQVARLDVVCGHKKPNGEILFPDKQKGFRIERIN